MRSDQAKPPAKLSGSSGNLVVALVVVGAAFIGGFTVGFLVASLL